MAVRLTREEKNRILRSLRKEIPFEKLPVDEQRVLIALGDIGIHIKELQDLPGPFVPPEAVPVLLELLRDVTDPIVKDCIVRCLITESARGKVERTLLKEFRSLEPRNPQDGHLKYTIGWALGLMAYPEIYDEILEVAQERRHKHRGALVEQLYRIKDPRVVDVLIKLLEDPDVVWCAVAALRKLHPAKARPHLERLLSHPDSDFRKEVKRAIAAIDRAVARERERKDKAKAQKERDS